MRNAPPAGYGKGPDIHLICISEKQKYFCASGGQMAGGEFAENGSTGKSPASERVTLENSPGRGM
jgi:hypothetical protein